MWEKIDPAAFGNAAQVAVNGCNSLSRGRVKESHKRRLLPSKWQEPQIEPRPDRSRQLFVARYRDNQDALAIKTLPEGSGITNRVLIGPDDHRDDGRTAKDICDPPRELADR